MTNEKISEKGFPQILVPSSVKPVHSFDLWGTLVKQETLGPEIIRAYRALSSDKGWDQENAAQIISNYEAVLRGESFATGSRKKEFVDALEEPLWKFYKLGVVELHVDGIFHDDAITSISDIIDAKENVCIITTGKSDWVGQVLADRYDSLCALRYALVYFGDKTQASVYEHAAADLLSKDMVLVTHTEDQLKGFSGLMKAKEENTMPLIQQVKTIYVERAALATPEEVRAAGIDTYVKDLREVKYSSTKGLHIITENH